MISDMWSDAYLLYFPSSFLSVCGEGGMVFVTFILNTPYNNFRISQGGSE